MMGPVFVMSILWSAADTGGPAMAVAREVFHPTDAEPV